MKIRINLFSISVFWLPNAMGPNPGCCLPPPRHLIKTMKLPCIASWLFPSPRCPGPTWPQWGCALELWSPRSCEWQSSHLHASSRWKEFGYFRTELKLITVLRIRIRTKLKGSIRIRFRSKRKAGSGSKSTWILQMTSQDVCIISLFVQFFMVLSLYLELGSGSPAKWKVWSGSASASK
jgi:hypothetical protein